MSRRYSRATRPLSSIQPPHPPGRHEKRCERLLNQGKAVPLSNRNGQAMTVPVLDPSGSIARLVARPGGAARPEAGAAILPLPLPEPGGAATAGLPGERRGRDPVPWTALPKRRAREVPGRAAEAAPAIPLPGERELLLAARIAERQAVIAVVGLGHVGLPLALAAGRAGFRTIAFDIDQARIAAVASGRSPMAHLPAGEIADLLGAGRLAATADPEMLAVADVVLVCVPTPLAADGTPDLSQVNAAAAQAVRCMRPGSLLVLESTTWPGTTRHLLAPLLAARGWQLGTDAFLAYSPEREDPGNQAFRTADIPKLVAGADPASHRLAMALYGALVARVVPVDRMETAEAAKLVENVFRAVNIALANELKLALTAMRLDVWQVMEAAATKPFGFMPFWPGPGPGGHCIPVDPVYLSWAAREHGAAMPLLDAAIAVNAAAPVRVAARLEQVLGGLAGRRILLLGLGYKRNIADVRDSPALLLLETLEGCGAEVGFHDPLVPRIPRTPEFPALAGRAGLDWQAALAGPWDAGLIVTDHDGIDYAALREALPCLVDTRNSFARRGLQGAGVIAA
jgi:UDP-N-acetyl-D-glucosamine dehydrogenase